MPKARSALRKKLFPKPGQFLVRAQMPLWLGRWLVVRRTRIWCWWLAADALYRLGYRVLQGYHFSPSIAEPDFGREHTAIDGVAAATASGQAQPGLQNAIAL
jgi:hypothetical protein